MCSTAVGFNDVGLITVFCIAVFSLPMVWIFDTDLVVVGSAMVNFIDEVDFIVVAARLASGTL